MHSGFLIFVEGPNIFCNFEGKNDIMESIEIKNRIRKYIEHADDRILRIINAIIETDENELSESHREILDERLKAHQKNPGEGKSWEEVKSSLKKKNGV